MRARVGLFARSIRFRLALWFVLILAAVLAAFSVFVYARQANDLRRETLDRLELKTRQWEAYLRYGAHEYFDENRPLIPSEVGAGEPFLQESDILALIGLQGQVVQKAGPIAEEAAQQLVSFGMARAKKENPFSFNVVAASTAGQADQQEYLFIIAPISFDRRVIGFFVLGSPLDPNGQLPRLLLTLALGNLTTLGIALAGGYWLADRAMRPVKTITRAARQIGETDLSQRLNLGTQDELGELADTFDGMLARLQAAFDRQRQFTADASHELRTPLAIVSLEAGRALAARRTSQEYQRALGVIQSENEFMTRLVNNLLTLSRMDAGQTALRFEALDLSDVALEVVERLAPLAERRGVALTTGELPELAVQGDRQHLNQLLANLVENAIKYSRPAGAQVRVEAGQEEGKGGPAYAWVRVTDNGPGIPSADLPHLFDRFYQADKARSRNPHDLVEAKDGGGGEGEAIAGQVFASDGSGSPDGSTSPGEPATAGSGLGLSIAQWIAGAHGGEILVESEEGWGSVFTFRVRYSGDQG